MTVRVMLVATLVVVSVALLPGVAAHNNTSALDSYKIDSVHSSAIFRIKHLNVSYFYGRFNDINGTVRWDDANPSSSSFDVQIKTDSVDTKEPKRDAHLKSPDFFNAKQFPTLSFKSKNISKGKDQEFEVTGDLTIHGVTKSTTATVEHVGAGKGMQGEYRTGFDATLVIRRSDFGMNFMPDGLGDEIKIRVGLEGVREK